MNNTKSKSLATEYNCSCIDCGHEMKSEAHCNTLKCPKCGGQMRRAERPGPGQEKSGNVFSAKAMAVDTTCPKCGHRFDYAATPEKGMGYVACPKCGANVTQADCDENKKKEGAKNDTSRKWMSTGYLKSKPTGEVNREAGIIEGVKVCTAGEAQGHDVSLDAEFIDTVVRFGNERKQGLKARFGHPNMCSTALGTFLGRYKNFRKETTTRDDGSEALAAVADMFLSNEAKETPNGNLYDYVLGLAENEPDMFGTSIVFTPGREYRKTKDGENAYSSGESADPKEPLSDEVYVECKSLHACDCVDDPAANDGLFSRFSQETVAGQMTEFLDLNPEIWGAIQTNPSILEALSRYGNKMDEFIGRYREYRKQNTKGKDMKKLTNSEQNGEAVPVVDETTPPEEKKVPAPAETVAKPDDKPPAVADEPKKPEEKPPEEPKPEDPPKPQLSRKEFAAIADKFGDAIASKVMREGGDSCTAMDLAFDAAQKENEALRAKIAELNGQPTNGTPIAMKDAKGAPTLFKTKK